MDRSKNIDILKAVCAFLVVCIHINFPGTFGEYVNILATIAVPIFFMITGYYYNKTVEKGKEMYQIKKIAFLLIFTILIYYSYNILIRIFNGKDVIEYINNIINIKSLIKFILFNDVAGIGHAWYLSSILYTLIIFKFVNYKKHEKVLNCFLIISFVLQVILAKYSKLIFGMEIPYYLRRNFLLIAIPYFYLGIFINNNKDKIKLSNNKLIILAILFAIMVFIEKHVLDIIEKNTSSSYYIGTLILPVIIFIYAIRVRECKKGRIFSTIGKKFSTSIYIIHPMVIEVLDNFIAILNIQWLGPIIVYFVSILVSMPLQYIKSRRNKNECNLFNR